MSVTAVCQLYACYIVSRVIVSCLSIAVKFFFRIFIEHVNSKNRRHLLCSMLYLSVWIKKFHCILTQGFFFSQPTWWDWNTRVVFRVFWTYWWKFSFLSSFRLNFLTSWWKFLQLRLVKLDGRFRSPLPVLAQCGWMWSWRENATLVRVQTRNHFLI